MGLTSRAENCLVHLSDITNMTGSSGADTQAQRPKIAAMERGKLFSDSVCRVNVSSYQILQDQALLATHYLV